MGRSNNLLAQLAFVSPVETLSRLERVRVGSQRWRQLRHSWELLDDRGLQLLNRHYNQQQLQRALLQGLTTAVKTALQQGLQCQKDPVNACWQTSL